MKNISCSIVPNKFGVLWYRVVLFSFLLTITFSVLSLFAEQGDASTDISIFPIATTSGVEGACSAAFDGTNYLVGIKGDQFLPHDITARLISQTGALVGSLISVPRTGLTPNVAFDGNNYLMVWADDASGPHDFLYGQLIDRSGMLVGGQFSIADLGVQLAEGYEIGSVAFGGGNYLPIYYRTADSNGHRKVYSRIVSTSGGVGNEFAISSGFGAQGFNNVAFDGTNFLVVWCDDLKDSAVVGRFVSPTGTLGTEFTINASPAPSDNPLSVLFNGTNYLAVWTDETDTVSHKWDVFGQLIDKSGNLVGSVITIATAPGANLFPFIAFDGTNYLVTWTNMTDTTNWDIYGQYISSSGTLVGSPFPVDTDKGNQMGGFSGLAGNGKLFGIVNVLDTFEGKIGDVYGMLLSVGIPPKVTTGAATSITTTSAKLSGTVNPEGLSTTAWFEGSTKSGLYTKKSMKKTIGGTTDKTGSFTVYGLSPGTTYYYRLAATNSAGTSYGSELSFTTLSK